MLVLPGLFGAVIGSFNNVIAFRLPRGESLVRPASRCPACQTPIRPWHNVPIVGWIALRGRCHSCATPISPRYPLVEALTAALYVGVFLRYGVHSDAWPALALVSFLVPIALIDLDHRIIPNRLNAAAALTGLVLIAAIEPSALPSHLAWAAGAGGAFLLTALIAPAGMGMGDVKLVAVLGLYLGSATLVAVLVALLSGTLLGLVIMARTGTQKGRKTAVPFGPFLAGGGLTAVFAGHQLLHLYGHGLG